MTKLGSPDEEVRSVLTELLRRADLNIEVGLSACRLLNGVGRYESCEWGLKELLSRFVGSRHVGRVHAERLQAAIQRLPLTDAVDYADRFFDESDVMTTFDDESSKNVQLLLWEQAARCREAGQWKLSLSWYEQSLRLFLFGRSLDQVKADKERAGNVAKLHRNRATCLLVLGRSSEAEEVARKALEFDSDSSFSYFVLFKILVSLGKQKDAIQCVEALALKPSRGGELNCFADSDVDIHHALICLAAQHALENSQRDVAMATLHHLATTGKQLRAKLTAYRCLIRLHLTMCDEIPDEESKTKEEQNSEGKDQLMEVEEFEKESTPKNRSALMEAAINCVNKAFQVLVQLKEDSKLVSKPKISSDDVLVLPGNDSHVISEEEFSNEITWFMKITWNMALQFDSDPLKMKELFFLCKEILALANADYCILLRQKTCLLMCAACALAASRDTNGNSQVEHLKDVMTIVARCREICNNLAEFEVSESRQNDDKSAVLLALYHFEALAKLSKVTNGKEPQELLDLFQEICQLPQADAKTFETLAALSMETPACHSQICKMALRTAVRFLNHSIEKDPQEDEKNQLLKKRSSLYRKLIGVMLNEGSSSDPSTKDQCWICFNEIYQLCQNEVEAFPELDSLWFTISCWNIGVRMFAAGHVIEAEKWCSFALRMIAQLERFKESYENHMNHAYREILAKKDAAKSRVAF